MFYTYTRNVSPHCSIYGLKKILESCEDENSFSFSKIHPNRWLDRSLPQILIETHQKFWSKFFKKLIKVKKSLEIDLKRIGTWLTRHLKAYDMNFRNFIILTSLDLISVEFVRRLRQDDWFMWTTQYLRQDQVSDLDLLLKMKKVFIHVPIFFRSISKDFLF